jgi:hypothetical protein
MILITYLVDFQRYAKLTFVSATMGGTCYQPVALFVEIGDVTQVHSPPSEALVLKFSAPEISS